MRRDTWQALRSRVVFVNAPLERSESDSSARIGVSILRKISIGTVQIFQYRYLSKYRYFWQHYCVYEDTCKDGDSDAYKCVYVIVQCRQKRKSALLSHRKRRRTHIALLFEFQRLKIGCFKTAVLKNAWPCYRCSSLFRNEVLVLCWLVVLHLRLSPPHAPWWVAYKDQSLKWWKCITVNSVFCDTTK